MNIIAWVVLGLIAGAIAKMVDPAARGGGIVSTILLGIIGAFVGGTLVTSINAGRFVLTSTSLTVPGIIVAVLGAIIAVFIWHRLVGA